jgi:uncharacterized protein YjbJ (UPF0337 family)
LEELKGNIKEKWGDLTDDDLDKIAGRRDQLEGLIQRRYGLTKDQARAQIEGGLTSTSDLTFGAQALRRRAPARSSRRPSTPPFSTRLGVDGMLL